MKEYRRVPLSQLRKRLQVEEYEGETPYRSGLDCRPASRADQAASSTPDRPRYPTVQEGKKVKKGQVVGRVEEGKLGANIHASIDGKVRAVTPEYVEIVA